MISAWESLHYATLELVRSTPIKQRLVNAYRRHLSPLRGERLPAEIQESFEHVLAMLHGIQPLRGEDAVAASVRKMSSQEADECASLIVEIYGVISRSMLSPARPSAAVVQLHSVEREAEVYAQDSLVAQV